MEMVFMNPEGDNRKLMPRNSLCIALLFKRGFFFCSHQREDDGEMNCHIFAGDFDVTI